MRMRLLRVGATLILGIGTLVILLDLFAAQTGKLFARQCGDQPPSNIERLLDGAVVVYALVDELMLKGPSELEVLLVDVPELLLADDGSQRTHILHVGISRV